MLQRVEKKQSFNMYMDHPIKGHPIFICIYFLIKIISTFIFMGKIMGANTITFYKQWQDFSWLLLLLFIRIFSTRMTSYLF